MYSNAELSLESRLKNAKLTYYSRDHLCDPLVTIENMSLPN